LDLRDGILTAPEGIGLGIELDEEKSKQIRVDPEDQKSLLLH
jgi:L-alanine-DL-glutamate epimerase-like enolase superfamily enzyme